MGVVAAGQNPRLAIPNVDREQLRTDPTADN
jgi:hypothetical protein